MNGSRISVLSILLLTTALASVSFPVATTVPNMISLEGRLTNPSTGNPYTGTLIVSFSIWDASSGGNRVWQETQTLTLDSNGFFHALLGSVSPLPMILPETAYLELAIGGEVLSPRERITSSAFALSSGTSSTPRRGTANIFTTVDSGGNVGQYTSITIGSDGLPIISYFDASNGHLKVAHCGNVACSASNTMTTVDPAGNVGQNPSITIGVDNLPIISYYDITNHALKVAHCGSYACDSGNTIIITLDASPFVGLYSSIAIGIDGLPVIAYYDSVNGDLKVAHCFNISCNAGRLTATVDSNGDVGSYASIAISPTNLGSAVIISYYDGTNFDLKVAYCYYPDFSSCTITPVDSTGNVGQYTSIAIGADDLPVISYYDATNNQLKVAHCGNISCSTSVGVNVITVVAAGGGRFSSITIGDDHLPAISYYSSGGPGPMVWIHCSNVTCGRAGSFAYVDLDSGGVVGQYTSATIGIDGLPIISYYDSSNGDLKVVHCGSQYCLPYWSRR